MTTSLADRLGGGSGMFGRTAQDAPAAPAAPALPAIPKGRRANAYGGKCHRCGVFVGAGEGLLGPKVDGKWTAEHFNCEAPADPAPADAEVRPAARPTAPIPYRKVIRVTKPILNGIYTVVFEDESYRTLKVWTQDDNDDFKPGQQIVGFLNGPDNESNYKSFADINDRGYVNVWRKFEDNESLVEAVRVLVADPLAASKAYGLAAERCGVCGRTLSVKASIEAGIGPDCAKKFV